MVLSTLIEIKDFLDYDHKTGVFFWKKEPGCTNLVGKKIETLTTKGYYQVRFKRKAYYLQRLAWFFYYGEIPKGVIDHINGNPLDNRIVNLRHVSHRENMSNSYKHRNGKLVGCSYFKNAKKWRAMITINKVQLYLGLYATEKKAHERYLKELDLRTKQGEIAK